MRRGVGDPLEGKEGQFQVADGFGIDDSNEDVDLDGLDGQGDGVCADSLRGQEFL